MTPLETPSGPWNFVTYFVIGFVATSVGMLVWQHRRNLGALLSVYRAPAGAYGAGLLLAVATVALAALAIAYSPGFLKWGWFEIISDSSGNPLTAPLVQAGSAPRPGGAPWLIVPVALFYVALVLALPPIARKEEEIFRGGHLGWPDIAWQSVKFGLSHLLLGIPIVIGVVLILPGVVLGWRYRRAYLAALARRMPEPECAHVALAASYRLHALYNLSVVSLLFLLVLSVLLLGTLVSSTV